MWNIGRLLKTGKRTQIRTRQRKIRPQIGVNYLSFSKHYLFLIQI